MTAGSHKPSQNLAAIQKMPENENRFKKIVRGSTPYINPYALWASWSYLTHSMQGLAGG